MSETNFTRNSSGGRGDNLQTPGGAGFERNRVFVVTPFREDMEREYQAIQEACEALGLRTYRLDEDYDGGNLLREVTYQIEVAEFVIFDLTHERANVYYELGYAHGIGNEAYDILLLAKAGTAQPFDITPLRVHYYEDVDDLRAMLSTQLQRMMQMTR